MQCNVPTAGLAGAFTELSLTDRCREPLLAVADSNIVLGHGSPSMDQLQIAQEQQHYLYNLMRLDGLHTGTWSDRPK